MKIKVFFFDRVILEDSVKYGTNALIFEIVFAKDNIDEKENAWSCAPHQNKQVRLSLNIY